jgi:phosphate acetyltransferase
MRKDPIRSNERYERLLRHAQSLPPVTTAVAHPCDEISFQGAVEAARLGLIAPSWAGRPDRTHGIAERAGLDISGFPLKASAHSLDSAAKAVELIREGKAEALKKGRDIAVARATGIRAAHQPLVCDGRSRP